jgi:tricorn protease-like protein
METLPFPKENYGQFKLSPAGDKIAISIFGTSEDLWILNMLSMNRTRITNNGQNGSPVWIDNNSLYARQNNDIVKIKINQPLTPEVILKDGRPESLSMDGSKLIVIRGNPSDIYMQNTKTGDVSRITNTPNFSEFHASISPNGRWIAYTSDRANAFHVYLQEAIPDGKVAQFSRREGSEEPRWTSDGKHIIYRSGQQWMQVELLDANNLQVGSPELVLEGEFVNIGGFSFDITADGKKFLVSKGTSVKTASEIRVIKGWFKELQELVPFK